MIKGLCNTYLEGGGGGLGNQRGSHRGKSLTHSERGVDVTFNTYGGGHYFFHSFHKLEKW